MPICTRAYGQKRQQFLNWWYTFLYDVFNVRPFIKIDKPQDENEGNRKIQIFTTKPAQP